MDRLKSMKVKLKQKMNYVVEPLLLGKVYDVISMEKGWYRIQTELDEDYLFPPSLFDIVEE